MTPAQRATLVGLVMGVALTIAADAVLRSLAAVPEWEYHPKEAGHA